MRKRGNSTEAALLTRSEPHLPKFPLLHYLLKAKRSHPVLLHICVAVGKATSYKDSNFTDELCGASVSVIKLTHVPTGPNQNAFLFTTMLTGRGVTE